jgi:hypothetical protein
LGVAKAKRNGHTCQAKGMGAFRSKSIHAKPFALRAFHFNPSPATQFIMHVFLKCTLLTGSSKNSISFTYLPLLAKCLAWEKTGMR